MKTAAERRVRDERIAEIPWVTRASDEKPCQGIKYSKLAMSATTIPDRARCKLRAKWHFIALQRKDQMLAGTTGDYCIHHLFSQIYDHRDEYERFEIWCKEQQPDR